MSINYKEQVKALNNDEVHWLLSRTGMDTRIKVENKKITLLEALAEQIQIDEALLEDSHPISYLEECWFGQSPLSCHS